MCIIICSLTLYNLRPTCRNTIKMTMQLSEQLFKLLWQIKKLCWSMCCLPFSMYHDMS